MLSGGRRVTFSHDRWSERGIVTYAVYNTEMSFDATNHDLAARIEFDATQS